MAHRSQCSSAGDNPLDPNYLPPHYREEYRLAIDALVENDLEGYYEFLQNADVVDFLSKQEAEYIKHTTQEPKQSTQPAQCAPEQDMDEGGEGSSDTYWPLHSDLDAPDLDLGWPQEHRFVGPTEVTTLVNPSEPDMPSIKEHARRLIKNSYQLVAVVMDMFTDVDIFADILDAAGRNVAVYILLDEHNVHHFTNMVSNCRVNLENFPFMRVRIVSGLTYYCRTGKSFKGQMMNRFLLTDCRAVLSGNYSFMWSFEKIHRCIAHLFLGQLVTTFDEEFRVLFAQSKPLFENVLAPVPDFNSLCDRLSSTDQTPLFRDPRKVLPLENTGCMEWARHSFDERIYVDQKQMAFRKHELFHRSLDQGQLEMYNSSQHLRMDPSLMEQGPSLNLSEFKRHNAAHGTHVRVPSYRFMQHQEMVGFEIQGRQMQREPQKEHPLYQRAGPDTGYAGYDKGYLSMDQYSHSEYPPEMDPEPYDRVLNYLSSTSIEMKDDSAKATSGEISLGLSNPKRISVGQAYACQRSPTQKMPSEDNEFFQGPNIDHETQDLKAKQGMRDWRIHSYLNAFNNAGDEDLSMQSPTGIDPLEEPLKHAQVGSSGPVLPDSMFHTKELPKFQATSRLRKLQCYTKSVIPEVKKVPDTVITMASEVDATPSESSLTTEDKTEVVEVKEPKEIGLKREEYFHKTYNAAVQRSSRLKSSLIFSSQLEQHFSDTQTTSGQHDEEMSKNENDQSKLPFSTPLLVKRRSFTREPFEWSRYIKPVGTDSTITESSKSDDKEIKKQPTPTEVEQNVLPSVEPPKCLQDELPKTRKMELKTEQLTHSTNSFSNSMTNLDMSDPDCRLMFFKELAAQRKAEKNTPLVNITKIACAKTFKPAEQDPNLPQNVSQLFNREDISSNEGVPPGSTDAEKIELKRNQIVSEIKEKDLFTSDSALVGSNKIEKESRPADCSPTGSSTSPISSVSPPSPNQTTQEIRPAYSPTMELLSTLPTKQSYMLSSLHPTPVSNDSANTSTKCSESLSEGTIIDYAPVLNEPNLSVSPKTDNLFTSDSSPQCVPGIKQCPPTVSSESGTSTLSIPLESCPSASHNESVLPKNPVETKPNESQSYLPVKTSFTTKKGHCSSPTPPRTKCVYAPNPSLGTLESSSNHSAPSSTSSVLHPDPSETSLTPHLVTPETSLNPHLIAAETSSTPHPAPSAASLSPHPVTTGTSSTVNSFSSSTSSNSHPDSPKASSTPPPVISLTSFTSPCQENTPESQIQHSFPSESEIESCCTATESSPESHSGSVLVASSEIDITKVTTAKISSTPDKFSSFSDMTSTESCESSFPIDIESCSSSTQANSTSSVNPIVTEFNLIHNCTSVESSTPNLAIVVENSSLNKQPLSELCEFVGHESQIDGANGTPPASESASDQVIPKSSQPKNSKVSQSRYQSSTAKVLSGSNLRDDTKLLLEQISANSHSRAELAKETAVKDDAKKEEVHRVGNVEERTPERSQSGRQHRNDQERQSLLQRIKRLRKEKKVYSRFEMAP